MGPRITNIVFGQLAERVLRDALSMTDEHEEIVIFPDDLSFGPIKQLSGSNRKQWMDKNFTLSTDKWNVFPAQLQTFFHSINLLNAKIVCWVCKNAVDELCGFSALLDNVANANLFAIETTTFEPGQFEIRSKAHNEPIPLKLAHVSPAIASQLLGTEVVVSPSSRDELITVWRKVQLENAALRAIDVDGLKSVPASYFDKFLLARLQPQWQSAQRVVTFAAMDADNGEFFRVTMTALAGRLLELANTEKVKIQGDTRNWATVQVRTV
jgi:hypothetical protein